jgi:CHAT domain-containing protein
MLPCHACATGPEPGNPCLLDAFAIHYGLSAFQWGYSRRLAQERSCEDHTLLAVGNPKPVPEEWSDLQAAEIEAQAVAGSFGNGSTLLCGTAADKHTIREALPQTAYLHFACHGLFEPEHPLDSELVLGGGSLSLLELVSSNAPLRGRLVVMSACQTGMVDLEAFPEEAIGLAAGFLEAGLPAAIGTFWPVDDLSTTLLMAKFYELHLHGADGEAGPYAPAEALRLAQLWLRDLQQQDLEVILRDTTAGRRMVAKGLDQDLAPEASSKPFADPFFWAPFALYGV